MDKKKKKSNIYHLFFFHITHQLYSFHETCTEQTSELCFTLRKRRQITHSAKKCTTHTFWGRPRFGWDFSFCLFLKQFLPHPTHVMFSTCSSWPLNRRRRRCSGNDQSNLWQQQLQTIYSTPTFKTMLKEWSGVGVGGGLDLSTVCSVLDWGPGSLQAQSCFQWFCFLTERKWPACMSRH